MGVRRYSWHPTVPTKAEKTYEWEDGSPGRIAGRRIPRGVADGESPRSKHLSRLQRAGEGGTSEWVRSALLRAMAAEDGASRFGWHQRLLNASGPFDAAIYNRHRPGRRCHRRLRRGTRR